MHFKRNTILLTKLQPPQIKKNTLRRSRLLKLLKENMDRKLILLNSAAGYGKTTLISQFLAEIKIPYIFYHLEQTDSELNVFLSYLTVGIKMSYPEFGKRTENILHTLKYPNKYLEIIVGTFINEFVEQVPKDLLIILDDYHNIDPSTQISQVLNYLFSHAPPSIHFIISTRQTPNFSLSQMKAKREIFELTSKELKFTTEETIELLEDIHSVYLGENELKALQKHCEGWVTSLQLMLQSSTKDIRDTLSAHYSLSDMKNHVVVQLDYFNYFAQEIYNREEEGIKQFMADCSILEWLNPGICYAVTDRYDSEDILHNLETRNAFLYRMPGNNYRFHNLFRDFLSSKLRDSRRKKEVCLKAAHYFYSIQQTEYAANYYLRAGQYNKAMSIINKIGYDLTDKGKGGTVCSYIEKLPVSIVNQNPDILMVYAYALMLNGYPNEATENLLKATKLFQKRTKFSSKLARAFYELASVNFISGNDSLAMKWLIKALKVCPKKRSLTYIYILNSLGILYSRMGVKKSADAIASFRKALRIVKKTPKDEGLEAIIYNNWAMTERKTGNLHAAYEKSLNAIRLLKKEGNFCAQSGTTFSNAAWFSLSLGHIKRAYDILKLGVAISKKYNDIYSLATLWRGFAWYYMEKGDLHRAKEYLRKAIDFFEELQFKTSIQQANRDLCLINTDLGLLSEAEHNLSTSWEIKKTRDDAEAVSLLVIEAKLRRMQGKLNTAQKTLDYALRLTKKYGQIFETYTILFELANVLYKKAMDPQAEQLLKQAVTLSKEKGYDYRLTKMLKRERWMIELLMRSEKKYILAVLNQAHIPYHLVGISLFGSPKVFVDDQEIHPESWMTMKAMKLFCYLGINRGKPVPRDLLIHALWREASLRSGSTNLRKAIQHIRQAFKSTISTDDNPLLYKNKLYQISQDFSVSMDIEEFIRLIKEVKKSNQPFEKSKDNINKAINLFQDGLAKGWYDEWIEEMRSYYGKMYEECLLMMAVHNLKKGCYKESIFWSKRLIAKNFFEEEYHKKLWTAYAKLKKYNNIKQDFKTLEKTFKKELKTKLQRKTISLYNSFIK